uniref:DUF4371 domain-containing protein n=1 Tax=Sipha flava TaxID=143950 RepID=A0A2S2QQI7_9HEMI
MPLKLPATALISDRYGLSDRPSAAIASCVLQDVGMIKEGDHSLVIDKNNVRREKNKIRDYLQKKSPNTKILEVYFDSRKNNTYFQKKIRNKMYRKLKKKKHISLVQEPGEQYIGHMTSKSENGSEIFKNITCYLENKNVDFKQLIAIGCDETATNTGWKIGVIHNIEVKLGHLCSGLYSWCILTNFLIDICFKI